MHPAVTKLHTFISILFCGVLLTPVFDVSAWGPDGHRIVGVDALPLLDDTARSAVVEILGGDSADVIGTACSWPDTVRKTPEWEWSAPMHYVNIPRSATHYDWERDCRDGMCVTAAIVRYATFRPRRADG